MKIMINGQMLHESNIFGFDHANCASSYLVSKYLPKISLNKIQ